MSRQINIAIFVSATKSIVYAILNSPGLPSAVTDDKGGAYTRASETHTDSTWYTMSYLGEGDDLPKRINFDYADGQTDSFMLD